MISESELIGKFSNIYIMLLYSIMSQDIERVNHYLSDKMYDKYKKIIEDSIKNNECQMYDELNVHKIEIIKREKTIDKELITVKIISRYMDYVIDRDTCEYKRGINDRRIEKENILVFEKRLDAKDRSSNFKCPCCGASLDVNFHGVCPYCRNTVDMGNYDYILTDLKTFN